MSNKELFEGIIDKLAREPRSYDTADDPGFWTNGDLILCPSEYEAITVAEFLIDIFSEHDPSNILTGYYDPEEDSGNGKQNKCTGFYYVDID